jgi:hypothetical protein
VLLQTLQDVTLKVSIISEQSKVINTGSENIIKHSWKKERKKTYPCVVGKKRKLCLLCWFFGVGRDALYLGHS